MRQEPDWRPIESAPRDGTWVAVRYNVLDSDGIMAAWIYGIWDGEEKPKAAWWNGSRILVPGIIEWSPPWAPCRERPQNFACIGGKRMFPEENHSKPELFSKDQPKTDRIPDDWLAANRFRVRAKVMQALMDAFLSAAQEDGLTLTKLADRLDCREENLTAELNRACEELDDYADIAFALGMNLKISLLPLENKS